MTETPVCFSHMTALRIARVVLSHGLELEYVNSSLADGFTSTIGEAKKAYEELDCLLHGEVPSLPVDFLTLKTHHFKSADPFQPHTCPAGLPSRSLARLKGGIYFTAPELAFTQVCTAGHSRMYLLRLAFELCGTYQTKWTAETSVYQGPPLMSERSLKSFLLRCGSLPGSGKASSLLSYVVSGSASPRETQLALLLGLPTRFGGYGLGMPAMNYEVEATDAAFSLTGKRSFRCDLCWPGYCLDVEYQSDEMHQAEQHRLQDSRRVHALESMGWQVELIANNEILSWRAMDTIAATLFGKMGRRRRVRTKGYQSLQGQLRAELGLAYLGSDSM